METVFTVDLEERIRQFEEEKRQIEAALEVSSSTEVVDRDEEESCGYVADWYIQ